MLPDSGGEVKSGSFTIRALAGLFGILIAGFLVCLFFIVGYHIKLTQEHHYHSAISRYREISSQLKTMQDRVATAAQRLVVIQRNDRAFRHINRLSLLDDNMYRAGVGGHEIVDTAPFSSMGELRVPLTGIALELISLHSRSEVLDTSFGEIRNKFRSIREEIDNTPTIFPTANFRLTEGFGSRRHPVTGLRDFHTAVDFGGRFGQDIVATADGIVVTAQYQGYYGNCVTIRHKFGYETLYGHMSRILVTPGKSVKKGDVIGKMGSTGRATGVHVHYAVSLNGKPLNPLTLARR